MNTSWHALRQEAEDPRTSARRLAELAQLDPSLWELIIRNPQCDPSYREWILAQRPDLAAAAHGEPLRGPVGPSPVPATVPAGAATERPARRRHRAAVVAVAAGLLGLCLVTGAGGAIWWLLSTRGSGPVPTATEAERDGPRRDEVTAEPEDAAPGGEATAEAETDAPVARSAAGQDRVPAAEETAGTAAGEPVTEETVAGEPVTEETVAGEPDTAGTSSPADGVRSVELSGDDDYVLLSSPSQNISCELRGGTAGCSIADRPADTECGADDRVASYLLYDGTYPVRMCDVAYLGTPGDQVITLGYGETISVEGTYCSSEPTGMTCWDQETGHGMTLNRQGVTLF